MIRILCFFLSVFLMGEGDLEKIAKIDQDISYWEKEKKHLQKKAFSHRNKGNDLQFGRGSSLEARREYFLEQETQDKIHLIEIKIRNLLEEKQELLME